MLLFLVLCVCVNKKSQMLKVNNFATNHYIYEVLSKHFEAGLYAIKYSHHLRLGTIPFNIVPLCSYAALPVPLPLHSSSSSMSSTFCNLHWISCNFIFGKRKTYYESSVRGCIIQLDIDRTGNSPTNIEENDEHVLAAFGCENVGSYPQPKCCS